MAEELAPLKDALERAVSRLNDATALTEQFEDEVQLSISRTLLETLSSGRYHWFDGHTSLMSYSYPIPHRTCTHEYMKLHPYPHEAVQGLYAFGGCS